MRVRNLVDSLQCSDRVLCASTFHTSWIMLSTILSKIAFCLPVNVFQMNWHACGKALLTTSPLQTSSMCVSFLLLRSLRSLLLNLTDFLPSSQYHVPFSLGIFHLCRAKHLRFLFSNDSSAPTTACPEWTQLASVFPQRHDLSCLHVDNARTVLRENHIKTFFFPKVYPQ